MMATARLVQILASVVGISAGQLLLKLAALEMKSPSEGVTLGWSFLNGYLVAGLAMLGLSTLLWVWILRSVALSQAYPYMALCFVLVPLAGVMLLGEPVSWRQAGGTLLIIVGVVLIGR